MFRIKLGAAKVALIRAARSTVRCWRVADSGVMLHTQAKAILIAVILGCVFACPTNAQDRSDRARDGLIGAVKSVVQETALFECRSGKPTEVERFKSSEEYDPDGRVIGNRNRFIIDDPISRMLHYPFDESIPRLVKPTYWDNDVPADWKYGAIIYTDVFTYDNQARRSEWVHYGPDGAIRIRSIVTFDKQGRLAETKSYGADGALTEWNVIKRDSRGNVLESGYYKEDGTLVEVQKDSRSYLNKFVSNYEFDSTGNWIIEVLSRPVSEDGQPVLEQLAIRRRTITYY